MSIKSAVVKGFLATNKVKIRYVKNKYGYKKGVVVLVDGKIGYSLVNKSDDYTYRRVRPDQVPIIQDLIKYKKLSAAELFATKEWKTVAMQDSVMNLPDFDRATGIRIAIDHALDGSIKVMETGLVFDKNMPMDSDLLKVIIDLATDSGII